jgi:class 3 adenylate cyclase
MGASPAAAVALTRMNAQIDVRHVLPTIQVPTLVMHRTGDRCLHVEEGRYVAGLIPGARYVELRGDDHLPFVGDQEAVVDEIERFLRGTERRSEASQVLATILCVDSHHSQALAESDVARLRDIAAAQAQRFGGRSVACSGRHVFVAFDGPARAIRCGCAIAEESRQLDLSPGIGLHTGECDLLAGTDNGLVSKIATRVASLARAGDVLVSRTVVDLVAGSGLRFDDRGMHALAETERPWRVFAVRSEHGETDVSASPPAAGGRAARLLVHPTRLTRHGRG